MLARNCWEGEAGALSGSEPLGILPAWRKSEQPVGENSMGRRFKEQGVIYSLLTRRRISLHHCALHLQAFSREQLSYLHHQVKHFQCAVLNSVVADSAHGFASQCHSLNVALDFGLQKSSSQKWY